LFTAVVNTSGTMGSVGGGTTIPEQVVPITGTISVPFAGEIKVVGKSAREVERSIVSQLRSKAVDPQALVTVVRSADNSVTVGGDAVTGGQVQLGPNNERILEAIAVTGGIRAPAHETVISLTRGSRIITVPYLTLASNPAENIRLSPRDVLMLYARKRTYTAFGATGHSAEVPFEAPTLTLAQAMARVGGLNDDRADASGVYIYRTETAEFTSVLMPDKPASGQSRVPVIYRVDLLDPAGLFLAQNFLMREGDILYVSNSSGAELMKFLRIVGSVVSPAVSGAQAASYAK
jgi:polysaccharide biosynthesis/export protein